MEVGFIEDFKIVQIVLKGDQNAYADLVRAHHPHVLQLCLSMLLNRAEADDAAQDVFLKAFIALRKYKKDVSFGAWLYRIASNHCLDILRKRKRQKTDSLDGLIDRKGEQEEDFLLPGGVPENNADEKTSRLQLALQALAKLPPDQRQILALREVNGLSYDAICVTLDCSLDAVKARLRRARLKLQDEARHFLEETAFK